MILPIEIRKQLTSREGLTKFRTFIKNCIKKTGYPVFDIENRLIALGQSLDVKILKGSEKSKLLKCLMNDPEYGKYFK